MTIVWHVSQSIGLHGCVWVDTSVGVRKRQPEIDGCGSIASKMTIIVK